MVRGRRWQTQSVNTIINTDFARRIHFSERVQALKGDRTKPSWTSRDLHYLGVTNGIIPFALEVADKAAASFALQARYPFFDKRLAEFKWTKMRNTFDQNNMDLLRWEIRKELGEQ